MSNSSFIFVVCPGKDKFYAVNDRETPYSIGNSYEKHVEVFDRIENTLKEHPYPFARAYLEVEADNVEQENEKLFTESFRISRKIELEELKAKSNEFKNACIINSNIIDEKQEEFLSEMKALKEERNMNEALSMVKLKKALKIAIIPLILTIILLIIVPLLLQLWG